MMLTPQQLSSVFLIIIGSSVFIYNSKYVYSFTPIIGQTSHIMNKNFMVTTNSNKAKRARAHIHNNNNFILKGSPSSPVVVALSSSSLSAATSSSSLISQTDNWGNVATLTTISALSQKLGKTTTIGKLLGAPVTAMFLAFIAGSIGILPSGGSNASKFLQSISLNLATPLLLLSADFRNIFGKQKKEEGGVEGGQGADLLGAFLICSAGTFIASLIMAYTLLFKTSNNLLLDLNSFPKYKDGLKIASALMAKNIGGGINYIAVCQTLKASPNAIAAGLCVDNIFALLYFPISSALSSGRPDVITCNKSSLVSKEEEENTTISCSNEKDYDKKEGKERITISSLSSALALSSISCFVGEKLGGPYSASLPVSTLFTILLTFTLPRKQYYDEKDTNITKNKKKNNIINTIPQLYHKLPCLKNLSQAGETLGTTLLYLFFATAGAPGFAIAESVRKSFLPISLFLSGLYTGHFCFVLLFRKVWMFFFLKEKEEKTEKEVGFLNPQRLLVASSAAIGGPATAAALAQANGWQSLIGPSLLIGNLGYALATFLGIGFYSYFSSLL